MFSSSRSQRTRWERELLRWWTVITRILLPFDAVCRESRLRERQTSGRADMVPLAVMHDGREPSRRDGAIVKHVQRELAGRAPLEETLVQNLHTGEEMRRHLALL